MIIKNGLVFHSEGYFKNENLYICGKYISQSFENCPDTGDAAENQAGDIIDATGCYVIPGLTDIHFHGAVGFDFCDGTTECLNKICEYQLRNGITTVTATSMSYDEEKLSGIFSNVASYIEKQNAETYNLEAEIIGINMEGPFISQPKKGAQNSKYLRNPDENMFLRLQKKAKGWIKLCDMAPELCGAMDFIRNHSSEVHISLAHSDCDYDTAKMAFESGADHITHLYNGMNGFDKREPGIAGALFDSEHVYAEIIGDGIHVAPSVLRATYKLVGDDHLILISDSTRACGLKDGKYELGGQEIFVEGRKCTLADKTIAGSVTNLMDCLRYIVSRVGIPLESAVKMAAVNPVKSIGAYDDYGSLTKGKRANVVIMDKDLNIIKVIKDGYDMVFC